MRTRQVLDSPELRRLVVRRWTISLLLTAALFFAYYGFILLVALDKGLLARRLGGAESAGATTSHATTLGIPIAVAVIVVAWALTAIYVAWANRGYDRAVDQLRKQLED